MLRSRFFGARYFGAGFLAATVAVAVPPPAPPPLVGDDEPGSWIPGESDFAHAYAMSRPKTWPTMTPEEARKYAAGANGRPPVPRGTGGRPQSPASAWAAIETNRTIQ